MMDTIKIRNWLFFLLTIISSRVFSQEHQYPEIGGNLPTFTLNTKDHSVYPSNELSGKYYILDFWSIGCLTCVASFPKLDSLQRKYAEKLHILLVGREEHKRDIRKFFDVYKQRFNLKFESFFDSVTFKKFVPLGTPHLIWVNGEGKVVAITSTGALTDVNVDKFLKNENFDFIDVSYNARHNYKPFDNDRPILVDGNGGTDGAYLFRSIISDWDLSQVSPYWTDLVPTKLISGRNMYQAVGTSIEVLYTIAYFGKSAVQERLYPDTYPYPQFSEEAKRELGKRFSETKKFNYCMEVPSNIDRKETLMRIMQKDLAAFFGLEVKIVRREIPCYELVVINEKKFNSLVSNGGKWSVSWRDEDVVHHFRNIPMKDLLSIIKSRIISNDKVLYIDNINRTGTLSFELEAMVSDRQSLIKGLRKLGMDLRSSIKPMKVLEINALKPMETEMK